MGDRCNVYLTCRKCDMPVFEEIGFEEERGTTADPLAADLEGEEMNYGAQDELEKIAKSGIPFYGCHHAGECYGEHVFASHGGQFTSVPALEETPAAGIDEAGKPDDPQVLESILEYYALRAKAMAELPEA